MHLFVQSYILLDEDQDEKISPIVDELLFVEDDEDDDDVDYSENENEDSD